MKNILFIVLILTISCNSASKNRQMDQSLISDSSSQLDTADKINADTENSDDCIFDQLTQTDEFLSNIKELQNYKWDYNTRTATIILDNRDTLLISRGGCYHFTVSAEFRIINEEIDYSVWNNVFNKVLWIAKLLDEEFAYKEIKNEIDSNKVTFEKIENGDAVYFSSEYLQNNHYEITRDLNENLNVITLSYYIN
jgi:hypothetical protein